MCKSASIRDSLPLLRGNGFLYGSRCTDRKGELCAHSLIGLLVRNKLIHCDTYSHACPSSCIREGKPLWSTTNEQAKPPFEVQTVIKSGDPTLLLRGVNVNIAARTAKTEALLSTSMASNTPPLVTPIPVTTPKTAPTMPPSQPVMLVPEQKPLWDGILACHQGPTTSSTFTCELAAYPASIRPEANYSALSE